MEDGEESSEVCSKTAYEVPVATFWGSIKRSQKNVHDSFTKSQVMLLLCMWFGILNGSSHLTQIQHHILLLTRLKFIFDLCDRNESEMNKHGHKRTHTQKSIRFSLKTRPTDAHRMVGEKILNTIVRVDVRATILTYYPFCCLHEMT